MVLLVPRNSNFRLPAMGNIFSRAVRSESVLGKRDSDRNESPPKRQRTESHIDFVTEREPLAGIVAYANPSLPGFRAIIKNRMEDFIVREVNLEGEVVTLRTLDDREIQQRIQELYPVVDEAADFDREIASLFNEDFARTLRDFLDRRDETATITVEAKERETRVQFYALLDRHLGEDAPLAVCQNGIITVCWPNDESQPRGEGLPVDYSKLGGDYLQCNVYKSGMDTMTAVSRISSITRIPERRISYAGTKDARAVTVQSMTIFNGHPRNIAKAKETLQKCGIYIGDFQYVPQGLRLGDLAGNRFSIVLRDVKGATEQQITDSLESLRSNGFINYFGMQRFGTSAIMTHEVGREILKRNYEEAVNLILKPRAGDRDDFKAARKRWEETHDPKSCISLFPKRAKPEKSILRALIKVPNDYKQAIHALPHNFQTLYMHAYQSYVWNVIVSERVKRFGCDKPLVGDLVLEEVPEITSRARNTVDDAGRRNPLLRKKPKVLSEEDLHKYTIMDVVYPVPGSSTKYPENEIGALYKELLEQDGIRFTKTARGNKALKSLKGDYRPMLAKPENLTYALKRYNDPLAQLFNTDLDYIRGAPEPSEIPDGKYLALKLEFTLQSSQYATMALREVLRCDTSKAFQEQLGHLDQDGLE